LPDGCFVNAGNGLFVSTPEFTFLQMASKYPLPKLIALGLELCGTYSLPDKEVSGANQDASDQTLYNLQRLTSKRRLTAFVGRMKGWSGQRLAAKALCYIVDGSASPMESIVFMMLCLPYRYGGYGLPMPELNGRIDPDKNVKRFAGREFYRGDLFWRQAKVVVEYDSDQEHADKIRIAKDAIRRSDLTLCGILEVTVTREQAKSVMLFDKIARQLAVRMKKELRYKEPGFSVARRELRRSLSQ